MKNLLRAAGALSLGAASLTVANLAHAAEGGEKPWTVSAALRGFYDDNMYTQPSGPAKDDSFGFEISPSLGYGRTMENTTFNISYTYSARWYEARSTDEWDQSHVASLLFSHEFSPRFKLDITDDFVMSQEPAQFGAATGLVTRTEGDNWSNRGMISTSIGITERVSTVLGYRNNLYRYDDPAYEASLDRTEHLPWIDLRVMITPQTVGVIGYQYGIIGYDSDLRLSNGLPASSRDYDVQNIYGGVDHAFNSSFSGSLRAGAQITDYDLVGVETETTPFVDAGLSYVYSPGSSVSAGVRHMLNATDVDVALNQESTVFYARWTHAITAKVKASALGQFQNSEFNGGRYDGQSENFWTVGFDLSYDITTHIALTATYYYDKLDSDVNFNQGVPGAPVFNRGYDRNRFYLGVRASF
jgi:hypothetical protein